MIWEEKERESIIKGVGESNVFYLPKTSQNWTYLLVQYFGNMVLIASECFDR